MARLGGDGRRLLNRLWMVGLNIFVFCGGVSGTRLRCPSFALLRLVYRLPCLMDYSQIITMEPGKRSGKPCIRGLRITVADVLGYLASGMTHEEILRDFPYLTEDDIRASLAFAADRERKLETVMA
jgi:uncharacterized protein (DUF433 family)